MTFQSSVKDRIENYAKQYQEEIQVVKRFLALLNHPDAYQRTHQPGHITGSAFIVSEDQSQTLLIHHAKLNRWLQPGGHADGNPDVAGVALREATEETGIVRLEFVSHEIYDLDIHPIPERKDFPAHDHYDIRFLMKASTADPLIISEESHDVRWVHLDELEDYNPESSLVRLRDKLSR